MLKAFIPERASPEVRTEQVRLLYHQGSAIQLLGVVTAIVAVAMLWGAADHIRLGIWLLFMVILSLLRLAMNVAFARSRAAGPAIEKWARLYVAGTFVSGVGWGALAFFFDPSWPTPYQVFLFAVYTGLIAGAFNTNSSFFVAFPAFYLPPVLCLMYVTLQQVQTGYHELFMLFMIYVVLMYVSSLKVNRRLA